jgi:4-amino-4-deoxy-L-arabinose transferase-like glycosyltransferase
MFILALAPRLAGLEQHLTADDQDWMRRASSFAVSVQRDNPRGTYQSAHPGVPVLWLATLAIGPERAEALARAGTLAELEKSPHYLPALFDVRRALAVASALLTAVVALLAWRLFGPLAGLLAGLLLAFEPFLVAHGRLFHTDPLLALLMAASVLAAMAALGAAPPLPYMVLSGALAGLAFLTKAPGVFLFGFVPLLALTTTWRRTRRVGLTEVRRLVLLLAPWGLAALVAYVLLWPALWVEPLRTLERMVDAVRGVGESPRRWGNFFLGQAVPEDVGPLFYPVATVLRLSPVTMVGLGLLAAIGLRRRAEGVSDKGREARTDGGWAARTDGGWAASGTLTLLDFVVLFTAMMTLSDKKLDRYLLPVYPVLVIMAAVGFAAAIQRWLPPSVPPSLRPSVSAAPPLSPSVPPPLSERRRP